MKSLLQFRGWGWFTEWCSLHCQLHALVENGCVRGQFTEGCDGAKTETNAKSPFDSGPTLVFWSRSVARAKEAYKGFLSWAQQLAARPLIDPWQQWQRRCVLMDWMDRTLWQCDWNLGEMGLKHAFSCTSFSRDAVYNSTMTTGHSACRKSVEMCNCGTLTAFLKPFTTVSAPY